MYSLYPIFIVAATCFLPFARLQYCFQKLEPRISETSIEIGIEQVTINLYLFQCLGGVCGEQKNLIEIKIEELINAGNRAQSNPTPEDNGNGIAVMLLDSLSRGIATLFGDDDNLRDRVQVRPFAFAGVLVILLLMIASVLSLVSLLVLAVSHYFNQQRKCRSIVTFLREAISGILLCATILYPAATWSQIRSSASLGPGYIIMALVTANIYFGSSLVKGMRESLCRRQKPPPNKSNSSPVPIEDDDQVAKVMI